MQWLIGAAAVLAVACGGSSKPGPDTTAPGTGGAGTTHHDGSAGAGGSSAPHGSGGAPEQMVAGSGGSKVAPPDGDGGTPHGKDAATPEPDAGEPPPDLSPELYDPERVPLFELELSDESKAALEADPDTYVRGTLRYGDETVKDIGVRIKGEGSKRKLSEKAAFKIKFDEFVDDQSFRGLRRLTLNNMVEDPSFIAERLSYDVFRAAGLPAPRCNSARVRVNGEDYGVYSNVEAEDKTFLRRWFDSDDGNLYEEAQVDFYVGTENMFDLETNESKNDRSDLKALLAVIEMTDIDPGDTFVEDISTELDFEHYLRFTAAEAAVNQWDMYSYTVFYPNNFRIYRDPSQDRFVFLPWGMDMSNAPYPETGTPFIRVFELSHSGDRQNDVVTAGQLFRHCMDSAPCKASYAEVVEQIAQVYDDLDVPALAKRYHEQVKDLVYDDPRKEVTDDEYDAAYAKLLSTVEGRTAALRADLQ